MRTLIIIYLLTAFGASHARECGRRIIFLPQTHAVNGTSKAKPSAAQAARIVASQLKVAHYLERIPQLPVFSEQTSFLDLHWNMVSEPPGRSHGASVQDHFSAGLPLRPEDLTKSQRQKLIDYGGDLVQLMRGRITTLHRVIESRAEHERISGPITTWLKKPENQSARTYPPEIGRLIYAARERAALMEIQNYFSREPTQTIAVLIFGSNHNFSLYPDLFPPECVDVPPEFQRDWRGRLRRGPRGF